MIIKTELQKASKNNDTYIINVSNVVIVVKLVTYYNYNTNQNTYV